MSAAPAGRFAPNSALQNSTILCISELKIGIAPSLRDKIALWPK